MKKYSSIFKESILDTVKKDLNPNIFIKDKLKPVVKDVVTNNFITWVNPVKELYNKEVKL